MSADTPGGRTHSRHSPWALVGLSLFATEFIRNISEPPNAKLTRPNPEFVKPLKITDTVGSDVEHPVGRGRNEMGLLGSLTKTVMNVVALPVAIATDVVEASSKAVEGDMPMTTTAKHLEKIKDDLLD